MSGQLHSWTDLPNIMLPVLELGPGHLETSDTARWSANDIPTLSEVPADVIAWRQDPNLVTRILATFHDALEGAGLGNAPIEQGQTWADQVADSIKISPLCNELSVRDINTNLTGFISEVVGALYDITGRGQAYVTQFSATRRHGRQRDVRLVVLQARRELESLALEFEWPGVMLRKRSGLEGQGTIPIRHPAANHRAMLVRIFLQMLADNNRFAVFFSGYTWMAVERVNFATTQPGLLLSPLYKTCAPAEAIPPIGSIIAPNLESAPLLAFIIAVLCGGLTGFAIQPPPPDLLVNIPSGSTADIQEGFQPSASFGQGGSTPRSRNRPYGRREDAGAAKSLDATTVRAVDAVTVRYAEHDRIFLERKMHKVSAVVTKAAGPAGPQSPSSASPGGLGRPRRQPPLSLASSLHLVDPPPSSAGSQATSSLVDTEVTAGDDSFASSGSSPADDAEPYLRAWPLGGTTYDAGFEPCPAPVILRRQIITLRSRVASGLTSVIWRGVLDSDEDSTRPIVLKMVSGKHLSAAVREVLVYDTILSRPSSRSRMTASLLFTIAMPDLSLIGLVLADDGGTAFVDPWQSGWSILAGDGPDQAELRQAVFSALKNLHALGLQHGDFEPRNVLRLGKTTDVHIIDFGMSTIHDCRPGDCFELDDAATELGL